MRGIRSITGRIRWQLNLAKLSVRPEVWITHLKPGNEAAIMEELRAAAPDWTLGVLQQGQVIELAG